jgi:hypothetical protein
MNDEAKKFLREGFEAILEDIVKGIPQDNPPLIGVAVGVVYIPVGDRGKSTVLTGFRINDNFGHQEGDFLRDVGECLLNQAGFMVIGIKPAIPPGTQN